MDWLKLFTLLQLCDADGVTERWRTGFELLRGMRERRLGTWSRTGELFTSYSLRFVFWRLPAPLTWRPAYKSAPPMSLGAGKPERQRATPAQLGRRGGGLPLTHHQAKRTAEVPRSRRLNELATDLSEIHLASSCLRSSDPAYPLGAKTSVTRKPRSNRAYGRVIVLGPP